MNTWFKHMNKFKSKILASCYLYILITTQDFSQNVFTRASHSWKI